MSLVELTHFPGGMDDHDCPLLVNPGHVILVVPADSGRGSQCWMSLSGGVGSYLVKGSLDEILKRLNGDLS